jgi:hypothetical protein
MEKQTRGRKRRDLETQVAVRLTREEKKLLERFAAEDERCVSSQIRAYLKPHLKGSASATA